jgi:hypothetical protein
MFGKLIGASIGRRLAGRNSGAQGALVGAMLPFVARRAFGPLGLALAGGYVAKKLWDRRSRSRSGAPAV